MDRNRHSVDVLPGSSARGPGVGDVISSNKVLRNTYSLLALNLAFSAGVAGVSATMGLQRPGIILTLVGMFGLLFLVSKFRDSAVGVMLTFAFTGFLGYTAGPVVSHYLSLPGGSGIVATALGGTAGIFAGLSGYAMITKRDFSGMGSYLTAGIITAIVLGLSAYFFNMPMLSLAVSGLVVLLMSAWIIYDTQRIISGGETNYVMATTSLFLSIFNLFMSLLHILGFASSD